MRRLFTMELSCAVSRAFTKLGMAMAANNPMMATTIMISTSVKAALRDVLICITTLLFVRSCGVNNARGGLVLLRDFVHKLPLAIRSDLQSNLGAILSFTQEIEAWP